LRAGDRSGPPGHDADPWADRSSADHAGVSQADAKEGLGVESGGSNGRINQDSYKTGASL
jgi:hypothetical protein